MESIMNEIISQLAREVNQKRQDQIVERLLSVGYIFDSQEALFSFAKDRLTLVIDSGKPLYKELYLDFGTDKQMLVAIWNDQSNIDFSEPNKVSITVG